MKIEFSKIYTGDCRQILKEFPREFIDFIMFSPPYYGQRNYGEEANTIWGGKPNCEHEWEEIVIPKRRGSYGISSWKRPSREAHVDWTVKTSKICRLCGAWYGQLGLEPHWSMYIEHLREICRELKRVLKKTGSMYIVIGDAYCGTGDPTRHWGYPDKRVPKREVRFIEPQALSQEPYQPKCLMGIPWRLAFALIEDGWILRNAIIWFKPNAIPESVKDRLSRTYEFIFHFVKSRKYYYNLDFIRQPHSEESIERYARALKQIKDSKGKRLKDLHGKKVSVMIPNKWERVVGRVGDYSYADSLHTRSLHPKGKNPGDLWVISTLPHPVDHPAPYPIDICLYPILSSCPPWGKVLDPMCGIGTTLLTCELINNRRWDMFRLRINEEVRKTEWRLKWIGIEIVPKYVKMAYERLNQYIYQKKLVDYADKNSNPL